MASIVTKEQFSKDIKPRLTEEGKTIALCHGVFDLVHPGHIIHFEQAKAMGDVLVVSITAAEYVRKGPGRPYFNDEMRLKFLAAIDAIDYVMLSEGYTGDDVIEAVQPDVYVKGAEYAKEEADITGKISDERELVEHYGGELKFTGGQVFSSTRLLNTAMSALSDDVVQYMRAFKEKYSMEDIRRFVDDAAKLKILVVGDLIIDRYTYCTVHGLISKDTAYSTRLEKTEEYYGGSAAVARHLSSFTDQVTLLSMTGSEEEMRKRIYDSLADQMQLELLAAEEFPTIVKEKFLTENPKREEYRKVFAINNIPEYARYQEAEYEVFHQRLSEMIPEYDAVFVCDFGHGLMNRKAIDIIQDKAKFMILNCQTNSSNKGLNVITKYMRADVFTLDQGELKLAFPEYAAEEERALKALSRYLDGDGWLTRGSLGSYGICDGTIQECPAFTLNVKDTVGAGDSFLAIAGLFAAAGAPIEVGNFAGNIAGALGANIVGNRESVEKVNVLKYANTLMNV